MRSYTSCQISHNKIQNAVNPKRNDVAVQFCRAGYCLTTVEIDSSCRWYGTEIQGEMNSWRGSFPGFLYIQFYSLDSTFFPLSLTPKNTIRILILTQLLFNQIPFMLYLLLVSLVEGSRKSMPQFILSFNPNSHHSPSRHLHPILLHTCLNFKSQIQWLTIFYPHSSPPIFFLVTYIHTIHYPQSIVEIFSKNNNKKQKYICKVNFVHIFCFQYKTF